MAAKKKGGENQVVSYEGCFGPKMSYAEIQEFIKMAFDADNDSEKNNPNERFSLCIWGNAGCVLKGTKIRVRKVSDEGSHNIIDVK